MRESKPGEYSYLISQLRYAGETAQAIETCEQAIADYPENNFFYKVLGDLWMQRGEYKKASSCYLEQLKRLGDRPEQFKAFARFYKTFEQQVDENTAAEYRTGLRLAVERNEIAPQISEKLAFLLGESDFDEIQDDLKEWIDLIHGEKDTQKIRKRIDELVRNDQKDKLCRLLQYYSRRSLGKKKRELCKILIASAERAGLYEAGIELIGSEKEHLKDAIIVRSLLRISRKQNDYTRAEELLTLDKAFVEGSDFNVLYELVYYYQYKQDEELLSQTLKKMNGAAGSSLPIARTLYNFYLQLNMFPEARKLFEHIRDLEERSKQRTKRDRLEEQIETEEGVWNKIQELVSEQEHNRQMIAMRDLIRGFSHELGQPITNIRYSIQLYRMQTRMGKAETVDLDALMDQVLRQTERMGDMLARFRPIVSRQNQVEEFCIRERIEKVFQDMDGRLREQGIHYSVNGDNSLKLKGEAVQFDQIFYNLILNAMQAFGTSESRKKITVQVHERENQRIAITFSDNGPGIEEKNVRKIFEPFFTTKEPSEDHGGEGLGLFIVWNILKMFNGKIVLDTNYRKGAKFHISIETQRENGNE